MGGGVLGTIVTGPIYYVIQIQAELGGRYTLDGRSSHGRPNPIAISVFVCFTWLSSQYAIQAHLN